MSVTQQQIDDLTASMSTLQSSFDGLSGSMDAATFGEDVMWVLICGTLVFFMQAGFAMLEAGAVRSKNAVNILFKNLIDGAISAICFWILGYGFAYGNTKGGFIGVSLYALSGDEFDLNDTDQLNFQSFFFQWAFAATAATIVSGCVAERCKLEAYFIYSAVLAIWIYPVVVHWCWGQGWLSPFADQSYDYLFDGKESNNFIDFAGSGIVHATGGIAGCVAAIALGPRKVKCRIFTSKIILHCLRSFNLIALDSLTHIVSYHILNAGSFQSRRYCQPGSRPQCAYDASWYYYSVGWMVWFQPRVHSGCFWLPGLTRRQSGRDHDYFRCCLRSDHGDVPSRD